MEKYTVRTGRSEEANQIFRNIKPCMRYDDHKIRNESWSIFCFRFHSVTDIAHLSYVARKVLLLAWDSK